MTKVTELQLPLWIKILPIVEVSYKQNIQRALDCSYDLLGDIIIKFESLGWLTIEKNGRVCKYILTKEGRTVKNLCEKLIQVTKINPYKKSAKFYLMKTLIENMQQ